MEAKVLLKQVAVRLVGSNVDVLEDMVTQS